jgi:hypothetical protein
MPDVIRPASPVGIAWTTSASKPRGRPFDEFGATGRKLKGV